MKAGVARNADIELAYETFGDEGDNPLLLLSGAGLPMFGWPDEFCTALAGRGFVVTRFDNRDSGRSTRLDAKAKYTLADMSMDTVAVLDGLGRPSAHLFGMSLGGMIGQFMAVHHPARVRSLTSMSSSPSLRWRVCRPRVRTLFKLVALRRRVGTTREDSGDYYVNLFRITGSTG